MVHFTQGPGAFFTTFRTEHPGGRRPGAGRRPPYDPNVIDVEVVEDDDEHGPPELARAPLIVSYTRRP